MSFPSARFTRMSLCRSLSLWMGAFRMSLAPGVPVLALPTPTPGTIALPTCLSVRLSHPGLSTGWSSTCASLLLLSLHPLDLDLAYPGRGPGTSARRSPPPRSRCRCRSPRLPAPLRLFFFCRRGVLVLCSAPPHLSFCFCLRLVFVRLVFFGLRHLSFCPASFACSLRFPSQGWWWRFAFGAFQYLVRRA